MGNFNVAKKHLKEILRRYITESDSPDVSFYGKSVLDDADKYLLNLKSLIDVAGIYNASVLDIGCGFGWESLLLSLIGNNKVIANDIKESMTSVVDQRIAAMQEVLGTKPNVSSLLGDICKLKLNRGIFDVIYSNEAIEHCHSLEAMFENCYGLLKRGGRLLIINDSNCLNRITVKKNVSMWKLRDSSWEFIEKVKKERPVENQGIEPYEVMRKKIIKNSNPSLLEGDVERIAKATAGLVRQEIESISRQYNGGVLPAPPALSWCRNPVTGEYCERLLDPYEVLKILKKIGFNVELRHAFRKFPFRLFNRINFKPIDKLLFYFKARFVLLGKKT